jgi:hypothetical protein
MVERMPAELPAVDRLNSKAEAKANTRMSCSEKFVGGIAIAVVLCGFMADVYATTDGPSGVPFQTRTPSSLATKAVTVSGWPAIAALVHVAAGFAWGIVP